MEWGTGPRTEHLSWPKCAESKPAGAMATLSPIPESARGGNTELEGS